MMFNHWGIADKVFLIYSRKKMQPKFCIAEMG